MTDEFLAVVLSAVLAATWLDDLLDAWRFWRIHRDPRSFRAYLGSLLLASASLLFLAGSIALWRFPEAIDGVRSAGVVVRWMYVIVGVVRFLSRRRARWAGGR